MIAGLAGGLAIQALSSLMLTSGADVVGVFTSDFVQVFKKARPLKVNLKEDTTLMKHPVETGATVTDFRIITPIEVELSMILQQADVKNTYKDIKQMRDAGTLLNVQTLTDVYSNLLIMSLPHQEDADMYGAVSLALKLQSVNFVTAKSGIVPVNPGQKSTTDRGQQQGKPVDQSVLNRITGFGKR